MKRWISTAIINNYAVLSSAKGRYFRFIYGIIRNISGIFQFATCNVRNILSSCGIFVFVIVGFLVCPFRLMAEFDSSDSNNLDLVRIYTKNTNTILETIKAVELYNTALYTEKIYDKLGDFSVNYLSPINTSLKDIDRKLGFTGVYETGSSTQDTLKEKLNEIISAIRSLEIPTNITSTLEGDWVKADAFGFSPESSFESYLTSFYPSIGSSFDFYSVKLSSSSSTPSPYPVDINQDWPSLDRSSTTISMFSSGNFLKDLSFILSRQAYNQTTFDRRMWLKQSWNDWYAHTNLVSTLTGIYDTKKFQEDKETPSFNAEDGVLTIQGTGGTGSADDTIALTPVSTNSVDTVVSAIDNSEKKVDDIFDKSKIQDRYIKESLLDAGNYHGYDNVNSSSSGVWQTEWFTFDFSQVGSKYRSFMTMERLSSWRDFSATLWDIAGIVCCILLVRKWGNM